MEDLKITKEMVEEILRDGKILELTTRTEIAEKNAMHHQGLNLWFALGGAFGGALAMTMLLIFVGGK